MLENLSSKTKDRLTERLSYEAKEADRYYEDTVRPSVMRRLKIYNAETDFYDEMFPRLSKKSKLTSFDVRNVAEWMLPHMMRAFFSNDNVIAIQAASSEDYARAQKVKKLIQFQITQQNYGFTRFRSYLEEAMSINFGAHKCYWTRDVDRQREFIYADQMKIISLTADPRIRIIEIKPDEDASGIFHVTYELATFSRNQPVIESVPVSELRWSPSARTLGPDVPYIAHRVPVTVDLLRRRADAGVYSSTEVEKAIKELPVPEWDDLALERNPELQFMRNDIEEAARIAMVYEEYVKTDIDGDGRLEDVVVSRCGDYLLRAEVNPDGRHPFFYASSYTDPYKVWADVSYAEIIGQYQHLKTSMIRQMAVNLALNNDPRIFINTNQVNLDDLNQDRQWVRVTGSPRDIVYPLPIQPIAGWTMPFFEYIEGQIEQLSGRARITRGIAKGGKSDTATGMQLLFEAADAKLEGIIRSFAEGEGGFVEEFRHILAMNQRYIDQPQVIRLLNEPLEVTLDDINGKFDLVVNSGVGTGDKDQRLQAIANFLMNIAPVGMQFHKVTPEQWAYAASELMKLSGIENVDDFISVDGANPMMAMMQQGMGGGAPLGGAGGADLFGGAMPPGVGDMPVELPGEAFEALA